eukprot:TRINITY_DN17902_c0_g1_i1.p1 TRINITY_DN17902_c0_g1~~TRINITY_DN17902_c0_g1_i1.p1  ORF type:complete len:991 (-),score=114.47 TRINITY_DN17902_c0_g1_i1:187-3159(-)
MQRARSLCNASTTDPQSFKIPSRYRFTKLLGNGSYGVVAAFFDSGRGRDVAVKRVRRVFDNFLVLRRTLREIRLMRHFKHPNVLRLYKALPIESDGGDVYLSMELMDCDLDSLIHTRQVSFSDGQVRSFVAQILLGLMHLHAGHVVHRDLKPANIFVRLSRNHVKIGDLGLSRGIAVDDATGEATHPSDEMLTEYVVTRWYRSPEVLLARSKYGPPVDVWSVGCILYEMVVRKALFPGKNSYDQLRRILAVLGNPDETQSSWVPIESMPLLQRCSQPESGSEKSSSHRVGWSSCSLPDNVLGNELLRGMCFFDPNKRLTIRECLESQYLAGITTQQDFDLATRIAPADVAYDRLFDGIGRSGESAALVQLGRMLRKEVSSEHDDVTPDVSPVRTSKSGQLQRQASVSSARSAGEKQSSTSSQREHSANGRALPFQGMLSLDFLLGHRGSNASASTAASTAANTARTDVADSKSARRDSGDSDRRSASIPRSEGEPQKPKTRLSARHTVADDSIKRDSVDSDNRSTSSRAGTFAAPVRRPDIRLDKIGKSAWSDPLPIRPGEGDQEQSAELTTDVSGPPSPLAATTSEEMPPPTTSAVRRQPSARSVVNDSSTPQMRRRGASSRGPSTRAPVTRASLNSVESSTSFQSQASTAYRQPSRARTPPRTRAPVRQSTPPRSERAGPAAAAALSMHVSQPMIPEPLQDRMPSERGHHRTTGSSKSLHACTSADPSPATTRTPGSNGSVQSSHAPDSIGSVQGSFNDSLHRERSAQSRDNNTRSALSEKDTSRVFSLLDEMLRTTQTPSTRPSSLRRTAPASGATSTSRGAGQRLSAKSSAHALDPSAGRSHSARRLATTATSSARRLASSGGGGGAGGGGGGAADAQQGDELDFAICEPKMDAGQAELTPRRSGTNSHTMASAPTPPWLERHERTPRGSLKYGGLDVSPVRTTPRGSRSKTGDATQQWRSLTGGSGVRSARGTPPRSNAGLGFAF